MLELPVATRIMGTNRPPLTFIVAFPDTRMPLGELIARRVQTEIEREHPNKPAPRPLSLRYLTDENLPFASAGAAEPPVERKPNVEMEIEHALTAFREQRYFVFIDDKRIDDLDEIIELCPQTKIHFLRIMPLVGGC